MKKILSFCLILIVITCLCIAVCAEKTVNIVKTDIKADRLFNSEGFGSIFMREVYAEDGETLISMPEAALIDKDGNFLFPYEKTWLEYNCVDGIVSKSYFNAYNKFYLDTYEEDLPGFYNLNGEELFPGDFWCTTPMTGGYAFVTKVKFEDDQTSDFIQCLIDRKGNVVLDLQGRFKEFLGTLTGQYYVSVITHEMAGCYLEGMLNCWRYESEDDSDYLNNEFSIFFLDKNGDTVLELPKNAYSLFNSFTEGLALVKTQDGLCGFIDKKGEIVIPCEYEDAGSFRFGVAKACKDGKYGYINKKGETVIPFEYDNVFGAACGLFAVVKDGKCGLVDENNNVVVPLEYDDISSFEMNTAYAIKDGYVYIITGEDEITVKLDGAFLQFDVPPVLKNDRTLVPFRAIFEGLGATVDWNDETQTATAVKGDVTLKITIGDNKLYKNDEAIELDVPAQTENDRILVPIRAISEAFGCEVNWIDKTQTVVIFSE